MNRAGLTAALYLFLTFSSGVAVGGFGFWMYTSRSVQANSGDVRRPSPEEFRKLYVDELTNRCKLTPDQVQKLNGVLDVARDLFREVNDKHRPEYQAIQEHQTEQIRNILTGSQKAEFEKFREERDRRRNSKGPGRGQF